MYLLMVAVLNVSSGDPTIVAKAVTALTGSRVNLNTGTPTFAFKYPVTGSRVNTNTGSVTTVGKATILPNGSRVNVHRICNNISRCKLICYRK